MDDPNGKMVFTFYRIISARLTPAVLASWILAVVFLAGCQDKNQLDVVPVTGSVTLDGKPLPQGTVIFTPQKGRAARGEIASDGSFTLSTYGKNDGATVGIHQVAIIARKGEVAFESNEEPKWLIPRRYGSPASSGLECEVEAGKQNSPEFKLSSK